MANLIDNVKLDTGGTISTGCYCKHNKSDLSRIESGVLALRLDFWNNKDAFTKGKPHISPLKDQLTSIDEFTTIPEITIILTEAQVIGLLTTGAETLQGIATDVLKTIFGENNVTYSV